MAAKYGEINEIAFALACAYMPGPLTLILKKKAGVDTGIAKGIDTIGIRIPNDAFCLALAKEFGRPITTTSANKAGVQPERSVTGIMEQLGDNARQRARETFNIDRTVAQLAQLLQKYVDRE